VGPRAGLDRRKFSSPLVFDPDRPARIQSLYQLSYWARYPRIITYEILVLG